MKKYFKLIAVTTLALASMVSVCRAQESVVGKWKAEFDSQIGVQKYAYIFKLEGTNITGKALGTNEMSTGEAILTEIKINKDEISFVEPMKFQDNEVRIEYKGKITGDEIKFHRKVGEFAEEDLVAKRVTETGVQSDAASGTSPGTNSPPSKP